MKTTLARISAIILLGTFALGLILVFTDHLLPRAADALWSFVGISMYVFGTILSVKTLRK